MSRLGVRSVSPIYQIKSGVIHIELTSSPGIDGKDIQSLNLSWLRSQIALVGQSPALFDTTIFENICYGQVVQQAATAPFSEQAARDDVYAAAKKANAHDFILALPDAYETRVGPKGVQLSGGQRQRIAIARALIRKPKILLLDEATSALDSKSETAVQLALASATRHRTTIIVAHRLSTIRHADKIIVMSDGNVVETGNHISCQGLRDTICKQIATAKFLNCRSLREQDAPWHKILHLFLRVCNACLLKLMSSLLMESDIIHYLQVAVLNSHFASEILSFLHIILRSETNRLTQACPLMYVQCGQQENS